jgi:hypothetical protein
MENDFRQWITLLENVGDTDTFMNELHAIQEADPAFWSAVYLHVLPDRYDIGEVYISDMGVRNGANENQGKGRRVLKTLTDLADKYDVVLKLAASEDSESSEYLQDWYARHGFDYTDDYSDYGPVMIRKPNFI